MLPPSTPDLIALDLLDSVAELGSLGRAASRHRMSQPAVSMRMSQLERKLGLTLLQRSPTGARLTPAGERVVALSRRVLGDARELMAGVAALVAEESSHLRVAASLTVAEYLLPGWLAVLHRKSPDAILAVEVTNSAAAHRARPGHGPSRPRWSGASALPAPAARGRDSAARSARRGAPVGAARGVSCRVRRGPAASVHVLRHGTRPCRARPGARRRLAGVG